MVQLKFFFINQIEVCEFNIQLKAGYLFEMFRLLVSGCIFVVDSLVIAIWTRAACFYALLLATVAEH